jgi:anti-anti-sigma regulatory factor
MIEIAPTQTGCCIRVRGLGTLRESPAADDLATRTLADDGSGGSVVFDLNECEYLDSTFLGVLIDLYRRFGRAQPPRYFIAASADARKRLLGAMNLERLIPMLDQPPEIAGAWAAIPDRTLPRKELARHVMEAHRALAQVDSPMRDLFARIARQMENELKG